MVLFVVQSECEKNLRYDFKNLLPENLAIFMDIFIWLTMQTKTKVCHQIQQVIFVYFLKQMRLKIPFIDLKQKCEVNSS